jgi:hypothetical protein
MESRITNLATPRPREPPGGQAIPRQIGCQRIEPGEELRGSRTVEYSASQTQARSLCLAAQNRQFTHSLAHECRTVNRALASDNQVRRRQTFLQSGVVGEQAKPWRQARAEEAPQAETEPAGRAGAWLARCSAL